MLGIILSDLLELNFRRAATTVGNSLPALLTDIVSHPVSLVLAVFVICMAITSSSPYKRWKAKR